MEFKKYQHIERIGTPEVEGITDGMCHIFPKLDGTNGSIWLGDDGEIKFGSRNRELTIDSDNRKFLLTNREDARLEGFFFQYPDFTLYGEWLVPHTFRGYSKDAWNTFYVFDVVKTKSCGSPDYIHYDDYMPALSAYGIEYIPRIHYIEKPTTETLTDIMNGNSYLTESSDVIGEGIVIKNYEYSNKYGRVTWAKMVTGEFKSKHRPIKASKPGVQCDVEQTIINKYITVDFVNKEYAKIVIASDGWSSRMIPKMLNCIFYEFVREESWNFIKGSKMATINFRTLMTLCFARVKEIKPELF